MGEGHGKKNIMADQKTKGVVKTMRGSMYGYNVSRYEQEGKGWCPLNISLFHYLSHVLAILLIYVIAETVLCFFLRNYYTYFSKVECHFYSFWR